MVDAFPLAWPDGRPRTAAGARKAGNFGYKAGRGYKEDITIAKATARLQGEIERLKGVQNLVLSSNLLRNLDGSPKGGQAQPADPGIALYFTLKGKQHCLPCDTYSKAEQNIAAIAAHIEATRAIERYGVGDLDALFAGFAMLPPPSKRPWREVMGLEPGRYSIVSVTSRYKALARERHPDDERGSNAMMAELNAAYEDAKRELGL